jgi:hypothetical protein
MLKRNPLLMSILLKTALLVTLSTLFICFVDSSSGGAESKRKLGVYSICEYEKNWKGSVSVPHAFDPYYDFWKKMTSGSGAPYADIKNSQRFRNTEVNIQTIIPIPDDGLKSWDEFDLVFFYGHNNTIVPPHPDDPDESFAYFNYEGGKWVGPKKGNLGKMGWGTGKAPYDYYARRPVKYANYMPGAVTYLYYEYTSSLLGLPYDYGGGIPDPGCAYRVHWNDPIKILFYGRLGDIDLEWLILHGCQAVITATEKSQYSPLALECFSPVQGKFHIVMGHYKAYGFDKFAPEKSLEPLAPFASDLLSGVPIQTAYFDTDPDDNTSAIAAETTPFDWKTSTMANDRWNAPMKDYPNTKIFSQRWIIHTNYIGKKP